MKMFKKVFAVIMCVAMIASCMTMAASADEAKTVVDGIRWFPCEAGRENDDIWEVECVKEGCGCQRFTDVAEETGNSNFLDTVYGENGSLTITRNGNDATEGNYWPRIRTLMLEAYPELDLTVANTLYFDFVVAEGTQWNLMLGINGMAVKLSKAISEACGMTGVETSDHDGPSGTFKGSINLQDALTALSSESTESGTYAKAIQNMSKTFVPQLQIFCVGPVGASITINELFISTAEDTTGANCDYLDMGLVYGDEIYTIDDTEGGETEGDVEGEGDAAVDTEGDAAEDDTAATTTTKAADKEEGGANVGLIIGIIVAVVVIGAVVVVVVMKKKK